MLPIRALTAMALLTVVSLISWMPAAYAGRAKPGIQNAPPPRQPATTSIKKPADIRVRKAVIWPVCSAGPGISVVTANDGPNTAYAVSVCVKPAKNGLEECQTINKIPSGLEYGLGFVLEGTIPVTIKINPGPKNSDPDTGNNSCKVMKRIPIPDGKVYKRCKAETVNCHSN